MCVYVCITYLEQSCLFLGPILLPLSKAVEVGPAHLEDSLCVCVYVYKCIMCEWCVNDVCVYVDREGMALLVGDMEGISGAENMIDAW